MIKAYRLYLIFLVSLIIFVIAVGFNGLYGQDSYEYLRFTNSLSLFYKTGTPTGDFFWPLMYPILGSFLSCVLKPVIALQIISIISFVGAAIYVDKTIELVYASESKYKKVFVFLVFLLAPYLLRASLVVMSDMLAVFFLAGAYYYMVKYRVFLQGRYFFMFIALAMAAIATRYASFVLLIVPGLFIKTDFLKHFRWKAFIASGIVSVLIALPHFLLRSKAPLAFLGHDWITGWSPANFFKNSFFTADGHEQYPVYNILYVFYNLFHPAYCFAGVVLMLLSIKHFKRSKMLIPGVSILLYALFLAGIPLQNLRFLLLSFPLVVIVLYEGFKELMDYLVEKGNFSSPKKITVYVLIALIQLTLFYRVFMPFYHDNKIEEQVAEEVLKYPGIPIYTFSIDGALKAYGANNKIISMYNTKLDSVKGQKLVLFNEAEFADEWKGQPPMLNWQYLQQKYLLTKVKDLPDGWTLYTAP